MTDLKNWKSKQIWPSVAAADSAGKCPRPHAQSASTSGHWWYLDFKSRRADNELSAGDFESVPCVCKTCGETIRVNVEANDLPEV